MGQVGRWEIFNAPAIASQTIKKLCVVTAALRQWICNTDYSIKKVYEHNLATQHKVHWRHLVWNRILIPKTRFVCWLIARQGLKTKKKLYQLGVVVDDLCPLCGLHPKTHNHLFFNYPFSRSCVEAVKSWIGITLKPITHMDFRKRCLSKTKQHVLIAIFAYTLYHIWKCTNEAVWYAFVCSPRRVLTMIKLEIRQRCHTLSLMDAVDFQNYFALFFMFLLSSFW